MKLAITVAMCLCLMACAAGIVDSQPRVVQPLTAQERQYLSRVEADGRLLYEKDTRAATATDRLLERIDPADRPNFVGWVTYPSVDDYTVSFYERDGDDVAVMADVSFDANRQATVLIDPKREPSDTELSMLSARLVGLEQGTNSCSDRFNTVVIPSQTPDAWDVYVLAATTNSNLVKVGGHVKLTVSKSDSAVLSEQALSKSCLTLNKSGGNLPEGAKVMVLTVSHIVTPMPVAIHPYVNLLHGIDLAVGSKRGTWIVESGKLRLLSETAPISQ